MIRSVAMCLYFCRYLLSRTLGGNAPSYGHTIIDYPHPTPDTSIQIIAGLGGQNLQIKVLFWIVS
jgi:hypothetical protein